MRFTSQVISRLSPPEEELPPSVVVVEEPTTVPVAEPVAEPEPEPKPEAVLEVVAEVVAEVQQAEDHPPPPAKEPAALPVAKASTPIRQGVKRVATKPIIYNEAGKVVELSAELFNREVMTGPWFIEFYAPYGTLLINSLRKNAFV